MLLALLYFIQTLTYSYPASKPFGTHLGINNNVPGYSNQESSLESNESNYIGEVYSGMKWQCVEYARRWIIINKSLTFPSVSCASDIWHMNYLISLSNNEEKNLYKIPNGSKCPPKAGDLIIYKRTDANPVGHIGIISKVHSNYVEISEQNWDNAQWPDDYSRAMPLTEFKGNFFLLDIANPILGWMTYNEVVDEKCDDFSCLTCSKIDPRPDPKCMFL
jgi:hypothetical protein